MRFLRNPAALRWRRRRARDPVRMIRSGSAARSRAPTAPASARLAFDDAGDAAAVPVPEAGCESAAAPQVKAPAPAPSLAPSTVSAIRMCVCSVVPPIAVPGRPRKMQAGVPTGAFPPPRPVKRETPSPACASRPPSHTARPPRQATRRAAALSWPAPCGAHGQLRGLMATNRAGAPPSPARYDAAEAPC